jgi:hypothetical protein
VRCCRPDLHDADVHASGCGTALPAPLNETTVKITYTTQRDVTHGSEAVPAYMGATAAAVVGATTISRALHSLNEAVTGGTAKAQARTSEPFGYGISTYGR